VDADTMNLNATLTEADYTAVRRFVSYRYGKRHYLLLAVWLIVMLFNWFGYDEPVIFKIIGCAVVTGVWFLLAYLLRLFHRIYLKASGKEIRNILGEHTFEICDRGFRETNRAGTLETHWSGVHGVYETRNHAFLLLKSGTAHVIPKAAFASLAEERAFVEALENKLREKPSDARHSTRLTRPDSE